MISSLNKNSFFHSITGFDKLPTVNRQRVLYTFSGLFGLSFLIYLVYQLVFTQFNTVLLVSNIVRNDLIILLSIGVSLSIVFYMLYKKPKSVSVSITEQTVSVGDWVYTHSDITAFSLVDCLEYIEIVLKTTDIRTPFVYYYIPVEDTDLQNHISTLSQLFPYQDEIAELDRFHSFLRSLQLK